MKTKPVTRRVVRTAGVSEFAETNQCYWLLDLIHSHLCFTRAVAHEWMTFWTIKRTMYGAKIVATDGGKGTEEVVLAKQWVPTTDFPLASARIWTSRSEDEDGNVIVTIMLPEEY